MHAVRLALRPWRQSPFSQAATILGAGGALFFAAILNQLHAEIDPVIERIQSDLVWTLYVKPEVPAREEASLVDQVKTVVGASARRVELVTKEQLLERLAPKYPELVEEVSHLGSELDSIVPRAVTVEGRLPETAIQKLRQMGPIERVQNSRDRFAPALDAFRSLSRLAHGLTFGLVAIACLLLWQMARVHRFILRDAVLVLRQWGASSFSAAFPDLLAGLVVGAAGGVLAGLGWMGLGSWVLEAIRSVTPVLAASSPDIGGVGSLADRVNVGGALVALGASLGLGSAALAILTQGARLGAGGARD